MKHVNYKGYKIGYSSKGKGPAVVLLHGFCADSRIWEEFSIDLLEEKYRVVAIDLPGFGQSDVIQDITIEGMAHAVATVLEKLGLEKVVLIGHSMGGYVSLAVADKYPKLLSGLGLFHSQAMADIDEKQSIRQRSIDFIERQGSALYVKQTIPTLFPVKFTKSNAFLIEKLTFRASLYAPEGITAALKAMKDRPNRSEVLSNIACPVLFIIGKLDEAIPWENSIAQTHLPNISNIHILDKVGHMGMFEATKKTQSMVRQFVQFCLEVV